MADHKQIVPPAATSPDFDAANERLLQAALAVAGAARVAWGYTWGLRTTLDELKAAESEWRSLHYSTTKPPPAPGGVKKMEVSK